MIDNGQNNYRSGGNGPYPPYGQQGGSPYLQPPKKSALPKILIAVAAVLVVGVGVAFAFRGAITKALFPQAYLAEALVRTGENVKASSMSDLFPDSYAGEFFKTPFRQELTVGLETSDSNMAMFDGASVTLGTGYNEKTREILMDLAVKSRLFSLTGNQLYISPDQIALSIPDLYTKHQYITVDTATFAEDWNSSSMGMYNKLPAGFDLQEYLRDLFESQESGLDIEGFTKELTSLGKEIVAKASFKNHGSVTVSIGGEQMKTDKMSYTIDADDFNDYLREIMLLEKEFMLNYYRNLYSGVADALYREMESALNEVFDGLEDLRISDDFVINYYIGSKQLVNRMEAETFELIFNPGYGSDITLAMDFRFDMTGAKHLMDRSEMEINLTGDDVEVNISFKNRESNENNRYKSMMTMVLDFSDGYSEGSVVFDWDFQWNTAKNSGNEMTAAVVMEVDEGYGYPTVVRMDLEGKLEVSKEEIRLSDGVLLVEAGGQKLPANLLIDYLLCHIGADETGIDTTSSIDFFEVDLDEIMEALSAF